MRTVVVTFALMVLGGAAIGAEPSASTWVADMVEDEGGPQMMAMVYGKGGDVPPELTLMCADEGNLNLRYSMGSGPGEENLPPEGQFPFVFNFGDSTATLSMAMEEMDGAYTAYFPIVDPIIAKFKGGTTVMVNDPTGVYQPVPFVLKGSSNAIDKVISACGK